MIIKCQICKDEEASWAFQPFGPDEKPTFTLLGSHYHGFQIIKVGSICKNAFQSGDFPIEFEYKGYHYVGENHEVREVHVRLWLGESHRTSELNADTPVRAIMRHTPQKGIDIAALVFEDNSDLISTFVAAPQLMEACEEVDRLREKIEFHLEAAQARGYVAEDTLKAVLMALAKVRLALKAARGEE